MLNFAAITSGTAAIIAIVVAVLIIVVIAVSRRNANKKAQAQPSETPAPAPAPQALGPEPAQGVDAKTVAVIMAAVAAAMGRPAEQLYFRAIRRDGGIKSAWASSGTYEIIHTRQQYL